MNGGYNHSSWSSDHNLRAWQLVCTCKPLAAPHDLLIAPCNLSCQLPRKVSGEAVREGCKSLRQVSPSCASSPALLHLHIPFLALPWLPHSPLHIPMCPSPSLAVLLCALHFMTALLNGSSSPNCHHELRTTCTVC